MFKVLQINSDGTALVSTRGLRRVVLQPGNEIADELCTPHEAAAYVRGYNKTGEAIGSTESYAEAITYGEALAAKRTAKKKQPAKQQPAKKRRAAAK